MSETLSYTLCAVMFVVGMFFFFSQFEKQDALLATINQESK
jgi:hypothetical protein